jgi:hypothetical protein
VARLYHLLANQLCLLLQWLQRPGEGCEAFQQDTPPSPAPR